MSRTAVALFLSALSLPLPLRAGDGPASAAPSLDLSGGIYLFDYVPRLDGAEEKFEIYAFVVDLDARSADDRYGLHVEARARDSKLRPFYNSTVWFQEAYAWGKTPIGELHLGKVYRRVGLLWDDSFFGNVQYFNGLKLNPDYGAELVGRRAGPGGLSLDYSVQYFVANDEVNGSLDGREFASDPDATLRHTVTARLAPAWKLGGATLTLGLSGLLGRVDREVGDDFDLAQGAADLTLAWGPSVSYAEVLRQSGERDDAAHPRSRRGYDDATYLLVGTRWQLASWANLRLNYSRAHYRGLEEVEEELLPGVVFRLRPEVSVIVEVDRWKTTPEGGRAQFLDKSYDLVLHYTF